MESNESSNYGERGVWTTNGVRNGKFMIKRII